MRDDGDETTVRRLLRGLDVLGHPAPGFDPDAAPADPQELFLTWLRSAVAAGVVEPHAMTLSTVDGEGRPDARVLILKDVRAGAWWFATDTTTAKAGQLATAPYAALTFHWPTMGRQIRLRGGVAPGSADESAADFLERGASSRAVVVAAEACPADAPRERFAEAVRDAEARIAQDPALVSEAWVTYGLRPERVEFWQADPDRLHRRLVYTRHDDGWRRGTLTH